MPKPGNGDKFDSWFDTAVNKANAKTEIPYAVILRETNTIIGSTRFYQISSQHKKLAIGYTWYASMYWGTKINAEAKLLLLTYVFENLNFNRVEFNTDLRNERAQAAIKKLGATQEGILRQHLILDNGFMRDTVIFSMLKTEWPDIKKKLIKRLYEN